MDKRLRDLLKRVDQARDFPTNTCPASRHLHMIAKALAAGEPYPMLTEEPEHCAETMLAVLESLWILRSGKLSWAATQHRTASGA